MQRTHIDEAFDPIADAKRSYLRECALLLLGAMDRDGAFPADLNGVTTLIEQATEPEQGREGWRFAADSPDGSCGPSARGVVWVSPAGEGSLRLRSDFESRTSISVILHPDGQLGRFTELTNSGNPDSEFAAEIEAPRRDDERRFSNEHLVGVRVAPRQDPLGLVVTWVALYDSGVVVHYLLPRSPDRDDGSAIDLRDELGTEYSPVGFGDIELSVPSLRSIEFMPAVPAGVSHLLVQSSWGNSQIRMTR